MRFLRLNQKDLMRMLKVGREGRGEEVLPLKWETQEETKQCRGIQVEVSSQGNR